MALNLETNVKLITSGNVPTPQTLPNGYLAFGLIDSKPKLYGNVSGAIIDFLSSSSSGGSILNTNNDFTGRNRFLKGIEFYGQSGDIIEINEKGFIVKGNELGNDKIKLPRKTGTVALESDIPEEKIILKGRGAIQGQGTIQQQAVWTLKVSLVSGNLQVGDELVLCRNCLRFHTSSTGNQSRGYKLRTATNQKTVITQAMIDDLKSNSFHNLEFVLDFNNLVTFTERNAICGSQYSGDGAYNPRCRTFYLRIRRKHLDAYGEETTSYDYVSNNVPLTIMGGLDIKNYLDGNLIEDGNAIAPRVNIYME